MEDEKPKLVRNFLKEETKLKAVRDFEDGLISKVEVLDHFGVNAVTFWTWRKKYGTIEMRTPAKYTMAKKRRIVQEIEDGIHDFKTAAIAYNVCGPGLVRQWFRKLSSNFSSVDSEEIMVENVSRHSILSKADTSLEAALLKIAALETMIDLAEEQFKINIRKKSGAKQFK